MSLGRDSNNSLPGDGLLGTMPNSFRQGMIAMTAIMGSLFLSICIGLTVYYFRETRRRQNFEILHPRRPRDSMGLVLLELPPPNYAILSPRPPSYLPSRPSPARLSHPVPGAHDGAEGRTTGIYRIGPQISEADGPFVNVDIWIRRMLGIPADLYRFLDDLRWPQNRKRNHLPPIVVQVSSSSNS